MGDRFDDAWYRRKIEDLERALEALSRTTVDNGTVALLVRTATKVTYPTVAGAVFWCEVMKASATPTEGAAASYTPTGRHLYASNAGTRKPPVGTIRVAVYTGGGWTFKYG